MPLFFEQLNFDVVVDAEVEAQQLVELPAELVVLYRRYYTHEAGIVEEVVGQVVKVEL